MVIGLNPSTADETKDDPTIRRCIRFAKDWGFGALCMTNIFAWRDTDPEKMKAVDYPIGPLNDHWIRECAKDAGMVLAAWGKRGSHRGRANEILSIVRREVECLGVNNDGSPKHPLYIAADTLPIIWGPKLRKEHTWKSSATDAEAPRPTQNVRVSDREGGAS